MRFSSSSALSFGGVAQAASQTNALSPTTSLVPSALIPPIVTESQPHELGHVMVAARGEAAVHGDRLARDERGVRAGQERRHGSDLVGPAEPAQLVLVADL